MIALVEKMRIQPRGAIDQPSPSVISQTPLFLHHPLKPHIYSWRYRPAAVISQTP